MHKKLLFLAAVLFHYTVAFAQKEGVNWYFGNNAALSFTSGSPLALTTSAMVSYEACASISDGAGFLLFYTNSVNVWNRNHQLMANGQVLGGHESASQGAAIVRKPGSSTLYYIFVVDGCDNALQGGLKYSLVDMTQQGGVGAVVNRAVQVSNNLQLTEKLTIVPHSNGTDSWILVHGWNSNAFYAYLLTSAGVSSAPVVSSIGAVHQGGGGALGNANAVGYMKASPNGKKLALGMRDSRFELFDFDNSTGQLSNYIPLSQFYRSYGVEFSPDETRLFGSSLDGNNVYQYNLQAGSAAAIAASATLVGSTAGYAGALQLGPDGKIYVAQFNSNYLAAITAPNNVGLNCGFQQNAVNLGGRLCQIGLPNGQAVSQTVAPPTASITASVVCLGTATTLQATVQNAPGATLTWNFGDPASGANNTATGLTTTHVYSTVGTFTVTLQVMLPGAGTPSITVTQTVTVAPAAVVALGRDTTLCLQVPLILRPSPQPAGTAYRWQDGSTASTYEVLNPGTYSVSVTQPSGCSAQDEVVVRSAQCPFQIPNIITPNKDRSNEFFVLKGLNPAAWQLEIFDRWGKQVYHTARYDNSWNATGQPDGVYYYLLKNTTTNQHYKGWVQVSR